MEFIESKVELDERDLEMRERGYKFRLWTEVEYEDGMRFREVNYFYTEEELREYYRKFLMRLGRTGEDDMCYYLSDVEGVDLEKEILLG